MKSIITYSILLSLSFGSATWSLGQKSKNDKQFESKGYGVYLELQQKEDLSKADRATLLKMAQSSRKIGDSRAAEKLYGLLIKQEDTDPLHHLYYAQALQTNGRYLEARNQFRICDEQLKERAKGRPYDQRARLGWEACDKIAELKALGPVLLSNQTILNSHKLEFSPMYYKDGLLFVSTRTKGERRDRWLNDNYMDLYYAARNESGELEAPELFADELNTELHEGPAVFSKDEQTIYFTRNDLYKGKRGRSKDGTTKLNLYTANYFSGEWTDEKELPFNQTEFDYAHPALNSKEDILVFASNQKGGYGGMDLWAARLENGEWTKPVNLGSRINTPGDEVFPFIHADGTLYFSSNGWSSLGGLDVFMATQVYNHPDSLWEYPFNIGAPINSSSDDFGLIIDKDKQKGYFSSSRDGGSGGDDIYQFVVDDGLDDVAPLPSLNIDICVYDDDSRLRLNDAKVSIQRDAKLDTTKTESITNEYGFTVGKLRAGDAYFIEVVREGYFKVSDYFIMPKDVDGLDEYCIGMVRDATVPIEEPLATAEEKARKLYSTTEIPPVNYAFEPGKTALPPTNITGRVINVVYNKPLPQASIILLNRCTGEQLVMEVGDDGRFGFPLECGCEYVIKSKKYKFFGDKQVISLLDEDKCNQGLKLDLAMTPNFDLEGNPFVINTPNGSPDNPSSPEATLRTLEKGAVIELKSIFYDYDKWNIRADAISDLRYLVTVMKQYPNMEIELSSHTDSRGSNDYNQILAQKRADSAKQYLVEKGIAAGRIKAVGYGENRLKNTCKICSEADHQENRRTEVLITKFEAAN